MSEISPTTGKLLALSMLKGIGPATLRKMASMANFESATAESMSYQFPANSTILRDSLAWKHALDGAEKQVEQAERHGARILSPLDPDYPTLLAATKDDPFLLFVRGSLAPEAAKSVAVIGTREPTKHGALIAERIAQYLAEQGWSVVSGLAKGCDAIAHRAALDHDGHTVAVLAHGLHTVAPKTNARLAEDILNKGGALVSEYRFGIEPKRDRTQAGLAQGVVMVQSDLKGGSLHASRAALDYGRWLAAPYPTDLDRINGEAKIQANLTFADGSKQDRMDLLRCPATALDQLIVLRSREDYSKMLLSNPTEKTALEPMQGGLI
ncbi:DNA transporter [Xanthomonas perforans]|uniref:DNA transporter n=1 Tax=Xanthomonas perforans TaxID=442694 RepID=A0ABR5EY38_XANPE|nr:DNA-processing protein DprA [Xanthomonas perforans]KLC11506.1 DNA transporter [Xanthomonas perforans]